MTAPTVDAPIRLNSLEGQRRLAPHDAAVDRGGIILGWPWPELVDEANAFGERLRVAYFAVRGWADQTHDAEGGNYARQNAEGQIGAVLLATYLKTVAEWNDSGRSDPGWDLPVWLPCARQTLTIDAKTRQRFLLIDKPKLDSVRKADYYALVQHRDAKSPYIFCGLITRADYKRHGFDFELGRNRGVVWAVSADTLTIPAADFHPERW